MARQQCTDCAPLRPATRPPFFFPLALNSSASASTQGITTFMMTKIPFFREVVLMAFECEHCGFRRAAARCWSGRCTPRGRRASALRERVVRSRASGCTCSPRGGPTARARAGGGVQVVQPPARAHPAPASPRRNSELQLGGMIPEKGVHYELKVEAGDSKARDPLLVGRPRILPPQRSAVRAASPASASGPFARP